METLGARGSRTCKDFHGGLQMSLRFLRTGSSCKWPFAGAHSNFDRKDNFAQAFFLHILPFWRLFQFGSFKKEGALIKICIDPK